MKKLLLVIVILCSTHAVFARKHGMSILKIRLADNSPITVAIDDRHYKKQGRSLTIGDLPSGRHNLKIYKYMAYRDDDGGRARTIYSGNIKLEAGLMVSLVYDPRDEDMEMQSRPMGEDGYGENAPGYQTEETPATNRPDEPPKTMPANASGRMATQELTDLQAQVADKVADSDKEKIAESALINRSYSTEQVRTMLSWFKFESTKVAFAKWGYDRVLDKQNYSRLNDQFSFTGSKKELDEFLKTKQQ